jgi:zinc finger BED domain-containing protein 5/7/8/9
LYSDDNIKYGFSVIEKNGSHLPQCVICHIVLSNDAMRPGRLELHLITNHPSLKDKPIDFFHAKINSVKRMKLDSTCHFAMENDKLMEASYEIALLIAKDKKPHTIGESLVKPCLLTACKTVLNEESCAKVAKMSLSNDTIKRRIDDMAHDLKNQIIEKLNKSPFFSLQCDETTDISQNSQLLFYCKFIDDKKFKEEILFSQTLKTTTKAVDVFSVLSDFLISNSLSWEKVIGICTDGAQAITGCKNGFIQLVKEKNPNIIGSHCIIHRQALACKTLPESLNSVLNLAIKIINCVKSSALNTRIFNLLCNELQSDHQTLIYHTEVRWLSKGNMLDRMYSLKSEIEIFLMSAGILDLYNKFTDEKCIYYIAYLADFFGFLNVLNLKLQGHTNILKSYDTIQAFLEKISLWQRRLYVTKPNFSSFPRLNELLDDTENHILNIENEFKELILAHLVSLKDQLSKYFPDISTENWQFKLVLDPFKIDVDTLPDYLQEQTIDLKNDSQAKEDFKNKTVEDFWLCYLSIYPEVSNEAAKLLVQFSSTYLCESAFSALAYIKSKYRARLEV